jgi:hypothetical protein
MHADSPREALVCAISLSLKAKVGSLLDYFEVLLFGKAGECLEDAVPALLAMQTHKRVVCPLDIWVFSAHL